ncbi:PREDICTED: protein PLANT CADMIUM RESISTANCE 3-like isoform X2 [Amphimedon queenslandica]|uniref:Uncharacterized protein n=1 Tax=Amphimedon queenslandica TaxID=400682 RepID=A0AAN0J376_AMPQE|nr:PREDICTED: protein PLANT CADMIUM RESISTANCE 3-like isoform X2 [Amphimedon queenslandica]|eukprot:XP_019851176.1 PREDICTED: protein PLANT CADMIUM RESISTANCE 3-like isoform X2 [Amphimedon queenslandica]
MSGWEHGICGCFDDCTICLLSFLCPCIQVYRNANAIPNGEHGCCFLCGMCTFLSLCYDRAALRGDIRDHKGIDGTHCEDWLYSYCCFCLSLAQESQEMKSEYMLRE